MLSRWLGNWSSSDNEITQKCMYKHSVNGEVLNNCWYCDFFLKIPILRKTHVLWVVNLAKEECKESRSPAILPMLQYKALCNLSFTSSVIYHTLTQHYLCPATWRIRITVAGRVKQTRLCLYGTHVIMGIGQVITLFQPDTQDSTTSQWPHFLSRGMWKSLVPL